jgi:PAS domain S-box-containing protein
MGGIPNAPGKQSSDKLTGAESANRASDARRTTDKPPWIRLAWLPIPLLIVIMAVFADAKLGNIGDSPSLRLALNFAFLTLVSLLVAYLVGRSFLARLVVGCLLAIVFCAMLAGSSGASEAPEIRVGVSLDYRPYDFIGRNGQVTGFSVDLVKAVASAMGLRVRFVAGPWSHISDELVAGQLEVLPTAAKTPARETLVDFSVPHTETFDAFFVRAGQPALPNLAAAAGKEIVVVRADVAYEQLLERHLAGKVIPVNSIQDGLRLIAAGRHDAFLGSKIVGVLEAKEDGIQGIQPGPPLPDYKRVFSFAVHKGDAELLEKLNQGLRIVKVNGEYDRIYQHWLGLEDPWRKWQPYFQWALVSILVLAGLVGVLQWLVHRRTRELARANEKITAEVAERRKAEAELKEHRDHLEELVKERTGQLAVTNAHLQADITERKRIEEALRVTDERLRLFIEHSPVALAMFDREMRYLHVSRHWRTSYNLGNRHLHGVSHYEVFPEIGEDWKQAHRRGLAGEVLRSDGDRFERADGSVQWVRWEIRPWHDAAGAVGGIVIFSEDTTEQKRAEEALQEQAGLLDVAHDTIMVRDLNGTIRFWNHGAQEMYGYSKQQATERISHDLLRTVFPQPLAEIEADVLRIGRWEGELIHTAQDGARIVVASRWVLQRDKNGQACGVMEINNDITERKRAEEAMRESRAKLQAAFASMTEAVFIADAEGRLTDFNDEFVRYHRFKDRETCSKTIADCPKYLEAYFQDGTPAPPEMWALPRALRGETASNFEYRLHHKDSGETWWGSYSFAPIKDIDGHVVGAVVACREITERKRAEEALRTSEERWSTTLRSIGDAVLTADTSRRVTFLNSVAAALTGWKPEEAHGQPIQNVFPIINEQTRVPAEDIVARVLKEGRIVELANHTALMTRDGREIPIEDSAAPILDSTGKVLGVVLVFHDVTEKRRAQETLRRQADLLQLSFDAIIMWRLGGGIESWNLGAEQLYGYSEGEALGHVTHELLRTAHPVPWPEIEAKLRESGNWEGELRHLTKDGREVVVSTRHQLIVGTDGVERILETNRDITERRRAEQRIAHLSNFPELNPSPVFEMDMEGKITYANPAALRLFPQLTEAVPDCRVLEQWESVLAGFRAGRAESVVREVEVGRSVFVQEIHCAPKLGVVRSYFTDITEHKRAEETLRQSEERFRALTTASSDVAYRMSPDWREMHHLVGKDFIPDTETPSGTWVERYIPQSDQPLVWATINEAIRTKSVFQLEHRVLRVDGSVGWTFSRAIPLLDTNGEIVEWFGAARDITERKRAEEALLRSEKLASVGRMAAAIAHEINNPLAAVTNAVYLARTNLDQPESLRQYLDTADEELRRVAYITRQALGFYRESNAAALMSVNAVLDSAVDLLKSKIKAKNAVIEKQWNQDVEVTAVAGELRQLFVNLLSNSLDAIDEEGIIRLRVSTDVASKNGGHSVRVTVADNGKGVDTDLRQHIFEPFFTTKGTVGTGLGLWVSKQIIDKHGGTIRMRSSTNGSRRGTTFSIILPVEPAAEAHSQSAGA